MKQLFKKQLDESKPLDENIIKNLKIRTYFNNEEKLIGEVVLYAMLIGDVIEKEGNIPELQLNFITLNERHFDLFEYDKRYQNSEIPVIKLKNENT